MSAVKGKTRIVDCIWVPTAFARNPLPSQLMNFRSADAVVLSKYATKKRIFPDWQMGVYPMSSIESRVGSGLPGNHDDSIPSLAARHAAEVPIANIPSHFMRGNARDFIFDPAIHEH